MNLEKTKALAGFLLTQTCQEASVGPLGFLRFFEKGHVPATVYDHRPAILDATFKLFHAGHVYDSVVGTPDDQSFRLYLG